MADTLNKFTLKEANVKEFASLDSNSFPASNIPMKMETLFVSENYLLWKTLTSLITSHFNLPA